MKRNVYFSILWYSWGGNHAYLIKFNYWQNMKGQNLNMLIYSWFPTWTMCGNLGILNYFFEFWKKTRNIIEFVTKMSNFLQQCKILHPKKGWWEKGFKIILLANDFEWPSLRITSLNPMPNAQVCVHLTVHITKLQLQTTVPKPLYIRHFACIYWDPGRWKSWCLHYLWPVK
jgi:hypothetical protein